MTLRRLAAWNAVCLAALFAWPPGQVLAANDHLFPHQWGLHRIEAERAWGPAANGSGVVVAVVDTGVNFGHPDLAGKSAGEINTIDETGSCERAPGDNNGHGTQVAGVVAAASNNGQQVASVAPGSMILSVKALDCQGRGYISDVSEGIRLAARRGARVINLSLGHEVGVVGTLLNVIGEDESRDFQAAMNEAAARGALVVASAGNDALSSSYAGMENVLVVGASGPEDEHSFYSSSGAEIMAPGGNAHGGCADQPERCIVTTDRSGGHAAVQGTSYSAPHVAGVAALLSRQGHSAPRIRSIVALSADAVPAGPRVNAARAVGAPVPVSEASGSPPASGAAPQGDGQAGVPDAPARAPLLASAAGVAEGGRANPGTPDPTKQPPGPPPAPGADSVVLGAPSQGAPPQGPPSMAGDSGGLRAGGKPARSLSSRGQAPAAGAWMLLPAGMVVAAALAVVYQRRKRRFG